MYALNFFLHSLQQVINPLVKREIFYHCIALFRRKQSSDLAQYQINFVYINLQTSNFISKGMLPAIDIKPRHHSMNSNNIQSLLLKRQKDRKSKPKRHNSAYHKTQLSSQRIKTQQDSFLYKERESEKKSNQSIKEKVPIIVKIDEIEEKPEKYDYLISQIQEYSAKFYMSKAKNCEIIEKLKSFNRFFHKLDDIAIKCLLQIGKIIILSKQQILFQPSKRCKYFYIILCGRIHIKAAFHQNFVINGETICENVFFDSGYSYTQIRENLMSVHRQNAKACMRSCLLRIKINKFCCLQKYFFEAEQRKSFIQLQNLLKAQYFHKKMVEKNYNREEKKKKKGKVLAQKHQRHFSVPI